MGAPYLAVFASPEQAKSAEGSLLLTFEAPRLEWSGHSCPLPLTLILTWAFPLPNKTHQILVKTLNSSIFP